MNENVFFNLRDRSKRLAFYICVMFFLGFFCLLNYKYFYFGYYDWDFGIFAQAMWNLSHGSAFSSVLQVPLLANHANYMAFLLAPIYRILPHPITLLAFKAFSLTAGGYVLFLLARKRLDALSALILMLLYLTFPPNLFAILFEFDFETLSLVFIFLMYYFMQENRLKAFLLTAFLTTLIKENLPLVVIMFGIFNLIGRKEGRALWGIIPILMGAVIFYISIYIVNPLLHPTHTPNTYVIGGLYSHLGNSLSNIIINLLSHPKNTVEFLLSPGNIEYLKSLFGPLIFTMITGPHIIFLALPLLMQNLLANTFSMHTIFYHYSATIVPFIFIATLPVLSILKSRFHKLIYQGSLIILTILCILNIATYKAHLTFLVRQWEDPLDMFRWQMVRAIPPKAPVVSTFEFLSSLSQRENLYSFHYILHGRGQQTGLPFTLPTDVPFVLVDFNNPWVLNIFEQSPRDVALRVNQFLATGTWKAKTIIQDIILLEKTNEKTLPSLIETSQRSGNQNKNKIKLLVDQRFALETINYSFQSNRGQKKTNVLIPISFEWYCLKEMDDIYRISFFLVDQKRQISITTHNIGYIIKPTNLWKEGEHIREEYSLFLAQLPPGSYLVTCLFHRLNDPIPAQLNLPEEGDLKTNEALILLKFTIPEEK